MNIRKLTALLLSLLLALSLFGCAAPVTEQPAAAPTQTAATAAPTQEIEEPAKMTPGVYSVTIQGCYAPYTLEVEVDETALLDVRIVETHESAYLGQRAQEVMAKAMVEHQTANVDSITGATITTATMKSAVRDALTQAGASADMFSADATTPASASVKGELSDFHPDVIVVGAGITGLTAALTAADQGAKVLILEQNRYFGGSTLYSGGYIAAASGDTLSDFRYETDPEAFAQWLSTGEEGTFRPELARAAGLFSGKALDILTKYGAKWQEGGPIGVSVGAHGNSQSANNTTDGVDYFAAYLISASNRGLGIFEDTAQSVSALVEEGRLAYLLSTKAVKLLTDETGAVTGVQAEDGSEYFAPSVILASGGYANNEEMLSKQYTRWARSGSDAAIGNMFAAAVEVGAVLHGMDFCRTDGGVLPTRSGNGYQVEREIKFTVDGCIWLNADGVRFAAETKKNSARAYYDTKENTIYILMNQEMIDRSPVLYYGNYATFVMDETNEELARLAEEGTVVFKGDTLEEAAEKAGLAPAVVSEQIARYNGFCETGVDEDFGKDASCLIPMTEGPFYLFETIPNVKNTYGGLVIDKCARVLNANGQPISGLYAAGETAGNYDIASPSASYYGGNLHRGATFGYIAAVTALADQGAN